MNKSANSSQKHITARWALNGALSGAAAAALVMWVDRLAPPAWQNPAFYLAPGLVFGLVVGISLYRRVGGPGWRPAVFVAGSVLAWPAAWFAAFGPRLPFGPDWPVEFGYAVSGWVGGCLWSAILMAGAQAFPFARSKKVRFRLLAAGGTAGAVCMAFLEVLGQWGFAAIFVTLWGVGYAAMAAAMASGLPRGVTGK